MTEKEMLRLMGYNLNGGRFLPTVGDTPKIAMDAALQTVANVMVPQLFATWYSPEVVEILQSPTNSTEIFGEEKRGDWKDTVTMFPVSKRVGKTTAYTDFGRGPPVQRSICLPKTKAPPLKPLRWIATPSICSVLPVITSSVC